MIPDQNKFCFREIVGGVERPVKPYYLKLEYDAFDIQGSEIEQEIQSFPWKQYLENAHMLTIVEHPVNSLTEIFLYLGPIEQGTHAKMMEEEWSCCDVQIYGKD